MMLYHGFYHLFPAVVIWQAYLLLVSVKLKNALPPIPSPSYRNFGTE
ncbi:hypothetical protein GQ55_4G085600 [Panicum hallii var. hallii]|uniref:Uncharacterized protein n=2 Tax=Panicum hallii TaxID=206008 RepID=A0A2T7DWL4_9POAL|nr:hypothetical protein GQ55_4G085600 [Panicum hallii var. hallii]PVH47547.1 hypothetical protein PAHAL_4G084600 [Panicum hallii]